MIERGATATAAMLEYEHRLQMPNRSVKYLHMVCSRRPETRMVNWSTSARFRT